MIDILCGQLCGEQLRLVQPAQSVNLEIVLRFVVTTRTWRGAVKGAEVAVVSGSPVLHLVVSFGTQILC